MAVINIQVITDGDHATADQQFTDLKLCLMDYVKWAGSESEIGDAMDFSVLQVNRISD